MQVPTSLIGSRVFQIKFDYQTALELLRQEDDGIISVYLDLVIFSPFVLRSSDGTIDQPMPGLHRYRGPIRHHPGRTRLSGQP